MVRSLQLPREWVHNHRVRIVWNTNQNPISAQSQYNWKITMLTEVSCQVLRGGSVSKEHPFDGNLVQQTCHFVDNLQCTRRDLESAFSSWEPSHLAQIQLHLKEIGVTQIIAPSQVESSLTYFVHRSRAKIQEWQSWSGRIQRWNPIPSYIRIAWWHCPTNLYLGLHRSSCMWAMRYIGRCHQQE